MTASAAPAIRRPKSSLARKTRSRPPSTIAPVMAGRDCSGFSAPVRLVRVSPRHCGLLAAAPLTGGSLCRQRRAFLREDHREELRRLRLARILRDFVRRTGLFVEHLPGRVRFFLALPRDLGDDRAL